jgi:lysophospholipase L1-like esterase
MLDKRMSTPDYHKNDFQCSNKSGWDDKERYEKYLEKWNIIRLEYSQKNKSIATSKNVIVGNSLVHLFVPELQNQFLQGVDLQNRGIFGDTTYTLIERIDQDVLVLKPQVVFIEIGGNDLIQGKCLNFIENNLHKIIQLIQAKNSSTKIVLLSLPPTSVPELNSVVPIFNSFLSELPSLYKNVNYINLYSKLRDENSPLIKKDFTIDKDPIHFNHKAYAILSALIKPYLN